MQKSASSNSGDSTYTSSERLKETKYVIILAKYNINKTVFGIIILK
jgi:hypothetical protein